MSSSPLSAQEVADYFLACEVGEEADGTTQMKLLKLLYFAQGFTLAIQGSPLFREPILAWEHGPVVEPIRRNYKAYGKLPLPVPEQYDPGSLTPEIREILEAVWDTYGQFAAWKLSRMTHQEGAPWRETPRNCPIETDLMRQYFLGLIRAGREGVPVGQEPLWPVARSRYQERLEIMKRAPSLEKLRTTYSRAISTGSPPPDDEFED